MSFLNKYKENRPWGSFVVLDEGNEFKVKRISVKSGQKLSLQYHNHRREHWTVVKGKATVILGEKTFKLEIDESIYIPLKEKHSLANEEEIQLEIIEVQIGVYLEEDDIIRLEDRYGRI